MACPSKGLSIHGSEPLRSKAATTASAADALERVLDELDLLSDLAAYDIDDL
jgi:hypothetical protein